MKHLLLILLLISTIVHSQTRQPFSKLGKKVKVVTLTNGKYDEFFDEDSLQRVGSSVININTKRITKVKLTQEEIDELENAQASRFLSIDPLAAKYPELTPYQYASNRPIDGIDIDGLEYLTYLITISKTEAKITNKVPIWYRDHHTSVHGNLGQGVLYKIRINDEANKSFSVKTVFVPRNASVFFDLVSTEYGNYMGATSMYEVGIDGEFIKDAKHYDYSLPALDAVDNFAKQHDIGYDKLNAVGETGLFDDWGTTPVDEAALNGWNNFRDNYKVGSADPFNGNAVTKEERSAAWRGATLFDYVVSNKKGAISEWMQQNYKREAANHTNKGMYGAKDVAANYQLFLNKYMSKDKDGNWIRNESMWSKDKDGNWNPNKPKEL